MKHTSWCLLAGKNGVPRGLYFGIDFWTSWVQDGSQIEPKSIKVRFPSHSVFLFCLGGARGLQGFIYVFCLYCLITNPIITVKQMSKEYPRHKKKDETCFEHLLSSNRGRGGSSGAGGSGGGPFLIPKGFQKCFKHVFLMSGILF